MDYTNKCTEFSRDFEVEPKLKENISKKELLEKTMDFLSEEVRETEEAISQDDTEEIIDGFGDVAFIALNGIYKTFRFRGNSHEVATQKVSEVMNRICDANLAKKQADGTIKYLNGKVQKPSEWRSPEYADLIS